MIKNIGVEIQQDVYDFLKSGKTIGLLTTYSDKGAPHLTPVSTIYPKNSESILIAMLSDTTGYKNMVWQKKVMLSILESPNMCVHIIGRSGVVRAPSRIHPSIHIAQIDVIDIIVEDTMLVAIESGIKWKHVSDETKVLYDSLMAELRECVDSV
jgi:hypothetical protein